MDAEQPDSSEAVDPPSGMERPALDRAALLDPDFLSSAGISPNVREWPSGMNTGS